MITKKIAKRPTPPLRISSAKNATEIFSIFQTNEGPCLPTDPYYMHDPVMKSDVWIATGILFIMPGVFMNTNSIIDLNGFTPLPLEDEARS